MTKNICAKLQSTGKLTFFRWQNIYVCSDTNDYCVGFHKRPILGNTLNPEIVKLCPCFEPKGYLTSPLKKK